MSLIINGFIIFSLIITSVYFIGVLLFINDYEENKCEMTYMFEYPQYVRISQELDEKYPQYGLYAYSEGHLTSKSRNMDFDGIPVMFIPGNAGSHRQARSLASVALRKALNSRTPFHFDHFLVDLNQEFSGLNGALLFDHLQYSNSSLYRILDLYKARKNPPKSVVIYAHSVGGIIARRLVEASPDPDLIPIVLALATPNQRPPLMLDSYTYDFYKSLNSSKETNTTFVSVTGGYSDFLVPSFLTGVPTSYALNVATTQIPRTWIPSDHICIVWCKQLILALNRALFDSVDPKTKHIATNPQYRKSIFHHHLVHHNGLSPFLRDSYPNSRANVRNQGEWIEYLGPSYTAKVPKHAPNPYFYMIRLIKQPLNEAVTVVALNLKTIEWAFVCGAHIPQGNTRVCEEFTHLSHLSEISPSQIYKRRSLTLNLHDLMKENNEWTHVVLRALPSDEETMFSVDIYRVSDRRIHVTLPHMLSVKRQIVVGETQEKALRYELVVPQLGHVIQSYQLHVEAQACVNEMRHATASLIVPWAHQNQHKHFVHGDEGPFKVRLYESRPQAAANQSAVIQLTLDPNCRYKISIQSSIPGVLSQLARLYSPLLLVNVAAVILMTLNSQMKSLADHRQCSFFFVAIQEGAKPYYILTSVKLISRFLSFKPFLANFAAPDWLIMSQEGTDFFLLPLLLYICSVGIVWLLGIFLCVALVLCETTVHKLALKFLAKTVSFTVTWSDHVMSAIHKVPIVVAAALLFLTFSTTGGLALCVGAVFYFMRLTQLSQDYAEELVWYYLKKIGRRFKKTNEPDSSHSNETTVHDAMFFHVTIFLLWCLVTVINVPSALTWAHNFKYHAKLHPDPAFLPGLVLSLCAFPLWQFDWPKVERKGYIEVGRLLSVLAVASLIYAPISIFRLNYTISGAILVVVLHQLAAPNRSTEETREEPSWLETMKAKLE